MITIADIEALPTPTASDPLRILISGCVGGLACGADQSSYGEWVWRRKLTTAANVRLIPFCPEELSFGTPRELCNIHGGDGFAVLDGRARVLTESGTDWTAGMLQAANQMLEVAKRNAVQLAILMDISAACGTQVIYDGHRTIPNKKYQIGSGVCAALLQRNGFKTLSQRDFRTLESLIHKIDPAHSIDETAIDHHETEWYRDYFPV